LKTTKNKAIAGFSNRPLEKGGAAQQIFAALDSSPNTANRLSDTWTTLRQRAE